MGLMSIFDKNQELESFTAEDARQLSKKTETTIYSVLTDIKNAAKNQEKSISISLSYLLCDLITNELVGRGFEVDKTDYASGVHCTISW